MFSLRMAPSLLATIALLFLASSPLCADDYSSYSTALNSITSAELKRHVDVLADDTFEGREAGSRGGRAASMYLLRYLEKYGLRGAGDDGGYFQPFGSGYRNVLGLLKGRDAELAREVIVISAHYDHVGYGNRSNSYGPTGYIHNGADDNASGTAGLLETVEAFMNLPVAPKRSILFAFWDGEEKGLVGSKHWVANPTVPLDRIKCMINLDMIGRLQKGRVEVYGTRTSRGLRRLVSHQNHDLVLDLDFTWELKSNSDHYSFFSQGIPVLMLHTGLHDDYHRPSDDIEKINSAGMQQVARLLFSTAYELADGPGLSGFRTASRRESPETKTQFEQPLPPLAPRLGVTWDKTASQESGLLLNHVTAGSSADRAGLRKGDRVVQFAGRPVNDEAHFMADVLAAKSPVEVMVHRGDQRDPLKLAIVLSGGPTRLGIAWREDDAEPGTLTLTRVVPGSPAQRAGLQLRDRVYEIAGRRFASSQEFVKLATTLPSPVELLVERNGRLSTVRFDVPPALPGDVSGIQKTPPEFAPGIKGSDGESHEFTTTTDTIEDWWSI